MCVARASACDGNRRRPASVGLPLRFGASARAGVRIFGASRREAFTNRALTPLARAFTCCLSRRTYRNPQNDSRPKGHVTELSQNRESSFFSNTRNTSDETQQCPQDLPILLVTRQRKKHFTLRNHRKSRPPQPRSAAHHPTAKYPNPSSTAQERAHTLARLSQCVTRSHIRTQVAITLWERRPWLMPVLSQRVLRKSSTHPT